MITGRKSSIGLTALQITTATAAAVQAGASRVLGTVQMTIHAGPANTAVVYIGHSTATADAADSTDGFPLSAGEYKTFIVSDPTSLYAVSTATGQKVFFCIE